MKVKYFKSASDFRGWLNNNHNKEKELWVGYYKKASGKDGLKYLDAVDVALCFGWIDGVAKSVDKQSHANRFTPRKPRSIWSARNIGRIKALKRQGLMHPAGLKAFNARDKSKTNLYSFEQKDIAFDSKAAKIFKAKKKAWDFFDSQPPGYRKIATWWVISAKKPETRVRRMKNILEMMKKGEKFY